MRSDSSAGSGISISSLKMCHTLWMNLYLWMIIIVLQLPWVATAQVPGAWQGFRKDCKIGASCAIPKKDVPTATVVEAATVVCDFGQEIETAVVAALDPKGSISGTYPLTLLPGSPHLAAGTVRLFVPKDGIVAFLVEGKKKEGICRVTANGKN